MQLLRPARMRSQWHPFGRCSATTGRLGLLAALASLALGSPPMAAAGDDAATSSPLERHARIIDPHAVGVGAQIPDAQAPVVDGAVRSWRADEGASLFVVAMTSATCPLSLRYAPTLARIEAAMADRGVRFIFVDSAGVDSVEAMRDLRKTHGWRGPLHDDRAGAIAGAFGATTTTEVFLVDQRGTLLYRGAVDDQYGIGSAREAPRRRWLELAIEAALSGRRSEVSATTAPGCVLERKAPAPAMHDANAPTYAREIARLIQDRCVECHRSGGVAPFALESYDSVARRATMIRQVVDAGIMPPWPAAAHAGPSLFANDRSMLEDEKALLRAWIDAGMPRGNDAELPLPRRFAEGDWTIGTPDLTYQLPQAIDVPAEGVMPYLMVAIPTGLDQDRWIRAVEILPSDPSVVHHVLVFMVPERAAEGGRLAPGVRLDETRGFFAAYVPGNGAVIYPDGMARRLPARSTLLFQTHYTPNGRAVRDQLRIGFRTRDEPPDRIVRTASAVQQRLSIPPGASDHAEHASLEVPTDARILAFMPHMHVRGKAFRYELERPGEERVLLLDVPRWDFNWQLRYLLREPIEVPAGSTMHCTGWFDNGEDNPRNPDASKHVRWGRQSDDEMLIGYIEYVLAVEDPSYDDGTGIDPRSLPQAPRPAPGAATKEAWWSRPLTRRYARFDLNQDGRLQRQEAPARLSRIFDRLDINGDGELSPEELTPPQQESNEGS